MTESKSQHNPPDPIAESLRQAGPRPPMPVIDLDQLSAPALEVWQRQVARRRSRHRVFAIAASLAVAAFTWRLVQSPPSTGAVATGTVATVTVQAGAPSTDFAVGSRLAPGQQLSTSSQPAQWLTVELQGGHRLRLDAGTELRLTSASQVDLLRGGVYVEAATAPLRIQAAGMVCEHLGTRFEVRLDRGQAAVRVRDGQVRLRQGKQQVDIGRGEVAEVTQQGEVTVAASPRAGAQLGLDPSCCAAFPQRWRRFAVFSSLGRSGNRLDGGDRGLPAS